MDIRDFAKENGVTVNSERCDENPNMVDSARTMDNWKCVLKCDGRQLTLFFSQGYGHGGAPPKIETILECQRSEYVDDDVDFEEWASDFGYNSDSRSAERTFKACQKGSRKLEKFLGDELLEELFDCDW